MKYLNLNILYCTYMLTPIRNILLIINLVTFCSKLSVRKPYIIYLSENCVLVYIRVNISKLLLFRTWKVVIGNHFQKCWDTSRFSLKYCKISTPLAPYSMLSRGCHIFVLDIGTQSSNPTLNGGEEEGEVKSFDGVIVERQM